MSNTLLLLLNFLAISILNIVALFFLKNVLGEMDRLALLLTVIANKQGCTQEDIDLAMGKSVIKRAAKDNKDSK